MTFADSSVVYPSLRAAFAAGTRILFLLLLALCSSVAAPAQENAAPPEQPQPRVFSPIPEVTVVNPQVPCVQPPPVVRWQDYEGPFQKVVGAFGRRLDRTSVLPPASPHYKPGAVLCSLTLGGKFLLFAENTFDPVTFLGVGFDAGIDQAENNQRAFGQGAAGYGKRFGYDFANQATSAFFNDVMYSTIFSEDPRYYRLGRGSVQKRVLHAVSHTVVAKREDGANEFNFCAWLGTASSAAVASAYHTGGRTGVGPAASGVAISLAEGAGWDVLREFWPEVAHKFKLPFRDENAPQTPQATPSPRL